MTGPRTITTSSWSTTKAGCWHAGVWLRGSTGWPAYYRQLRDRNIGHQAALRQVANRLVGILHGCLKTGTLYNEHTAWDHHMTGAA